jgi:acetyltransferase-like isoleucine patch superfamily enzyme
MPGWIRRLRRHVRPHETAVGFLVRALPNYSAPSLRARLYRLAGCKVGRDVKIDGRMELYGKGAYNLVLEAGVRIAPFCVFDVNNTILLGTNVSVGPGARVFTSRHLLGPSEQRSLPQSFGLVVRIEPGAALLAGATVLAGVAVGRSDCR